MKVCFPVEENQGLISHVYGHFVSAPLFLIIDMDTHVVTEFKNGNLAHPPRKCDIVQSLDDHHVDVAIVVGIGRGSITKLNKAGIKVYGAVSASVADNMTLFNADRLKEMPGSHACDGHAAACSL